MPFNTWLNHSAATSPSSSHVYQAIGTSVHMMQCLNRHMSGTMEGEPVSIHPRPSVHALTFVSAAMSIGQPAWQLLRNIGK